MQAIVKAAYSAYEADKACRKRQPLDVADLAKTVDDMAQAVGLVAGTQAPREMVCDLIAHTFSKWCELRYEMNELKLPMKGVVTPFPDLGEFVLTHESCDFTTGRYIYAYAIGCRIPKCDEFVPLHSGWLPRRGIPRRWWINNGVDLHIFEMDDDGNVAQYKNKLDHIDMYIVGDLGQIATRHRLEEGKYTMRTYVYPLPSSAEDTIVAPAESAADQQ
jgi:hypothetical protein